MTSGGYHFTLFSWGSTEQILCILTEKLSVLNGIDQSTRVCVACSGPHAVSAVGDVYCCSSSELLEFSVSASQIAAATCSVPLKEGMRPIVEETEATEATTEEKTAVEKSEESPAAGEGKATEEQPVYVASCFLFKKLFLLFIYAVLNGSMKFDVLQRNRDAFTCWLHCVSLFILFYIGYMLFYMCIVFVA